MWRLTTVVIGIALVLMPVATPVAAEPVFTATGFYLAGSPSGALLVDACGNDGATEGVDSNCVRLGDGYGGIPYTINGHAETGTPAFKVCFYHEDTFLGCDTGYVPSAANRFSVSSVGGTGVEWVLTLEILPPS